MSKRVDESSVSTGGAVRPSVFNAGRGGGASRDAATITETAGSAGGVDKTAGSCLEEESKSTQERAREQLERAKDALADHKREGLKACDYNSSIFNQECSRLERQISKFDSQISDNKEPLRNNSLGQ